MRITNALIQAKVENGMKSISEMTHVLKNKINQNWYEKEIDVPQRIQIWMKYICINTKGWVNTRKPIEEDI